MSMLKKNPNEPENKEDQILVENQEQDAAQQEQAWWESAMFLNPAQDSDR